MNGPEETPGRELKEMQNDPKHFQLYSSVCCMSDVEMDNWGVYHEEQEVM